MDVSSYPVRLKSRQGGAWCALERLSGSSPRLIAQNARHHMDSSATSVYRYYDRHGILIYVGITARRATRQLEHNGKAAWWPFVAKQEVDHLDSREDAAAHEVSLIRRYRPPFNVQHNAGAAGLRDAYLAWAKAGHGDEDPFVAFHRLRRSLPLSVLEQSRDFERLVLRSELADSAVGMRLYQTDGVDARHIGGQYRLGRVTGVEHQGVFALIRVQLLRRRARRIESGVGGLMMASNRVPVTFVLRYVNLTPTKDEDA